MYTDEDLEILSEQIYQEGFKEWTRNALMAGALTAGALAGGHAYGAGKPMYNAPERHGDIVLHQRNYDTESKTIRMQGSGVTEKDAVNDAIRRAIEGTRGSMIDAKTTVQNDDLVSDNISTETFGNVEKYKVLGVEKDEETGLFTADVQVSLGNNMNSELGQGETRGGKYYGRTVVDNDDLVHDQFGRTN